MHMKAWPLSRKMKLIGTVWYQFTCVHLQSSHRSNQLLLPRGRGHVWVTSTGGSTPVGEGPCSSIILRINCRSAYWIHIFSKICCMYLSLILGTTSLDKLKVLYADFLAIRRYFLLWAVIFPWAAPWSGSWTDDMYVLELCLPFCQWWTDN